MNIYYISGLIAVAMMSSIIADAATAWVSPSGRTFPGYAGTVAADRSYATLHGALYAGELSDSDIIVLDRAEFDVVKSDGDVISNLQLTKSITVTGIGKPEETVVDGGGETGGRQ